MPGTINLGEMGALALHLMLEAAKHKQANSGGWLSISSVADALNASKHTLHKVTRRLVQAGLLESSRGATGGVRLAGDGEETTLLRIVEAVDGELGTNGCLFAKRVCPPGALCLFGGITRDLEKIVRSYFAETALRDLTRHK